MRQTELIFRDDEVSVGAMMKKRAFEKSVTEALTGMTGGLEVLKLVFKKELIFQSAKLFLKKFKMYKIIKALKTKSAGKNSLKSSRNSFLLIV